jgi:hypothetical protein
MMTASMATPPACKSSSPKPYGCCCSGFIGVGNATARRGKATPRYWSAAKWPDHGSP